MPKCKLWWHGPLWLSESEESWLKSSFHRKKHPAVLSAKHSLTILVFSFEHIRLHHAGPQLLLASIREKYWPLRGRNLRNK
ncbi:hypothetical protein NQ318_003045 [Aromia moschata]|uniref:Uncharacterized protein n=1 Tax=Aromia moschata TaxID=1265417 RepID=A0AAV8X0U7_9CUCU|nr:hypothetical protein NQ318_003045 [Aromia moschata]